MSKFLDFLEENNYITEGYYYIIGMKKGKKRYINSKGKWGDENSTLKKFDSKASAKSFVNDVDQTEFDEVVLQFKESLEESEGNGYIAFYGGKQVEVYADTSYKAQLKATEQFQKMFPRKKVKSYEVTVKLAEKDGKQVTHKPLD